MKPDSNTQLAPLPQALEKVFDDVIAADALLRNRLPGEKNLTGAQRKRLNSAGVRKSGFILNAWEIADTRPDFRPANFSIDRMTTTLADVERARQLLAAIDQLRRLVDDFLLVGNDALYRDALRVYANLQEQAGSRISGADELFRQLSEFFKACGRRPNREEPTQKEVERDFKKLMHGTADGEMVIRHESPHMTGGVHEVSVESGV